MVQSRNIRTGAAAILCALTFRLFAAGLPEKILSRLIEPNSLSFLTYLETGRNVRFSASTGIFADFSSESPMPWVPNVPKIPETPEPAEPAQMLPAHSLPVFSDPSMTQMYYACNLRPNIGRLLSAPLHWNLIGEAPTVLILHTHSTESYTQGNEKYAESSAYRTLDEDYNMLSIGARVAEILNENGVAAIQDRSLHDYPSYNGSYTDARKSTRRYLEENPSIQLVLDLHRDAAGTVGHQLRTKATVGGETSAQLMLVMGSNASGQSHGNWEENLALGLKLQAQLESQAPGITRHTTLRGQRFNQDLSTGALLVEVGAAGNSRHEALRAAEELAKAIVALAKGTG